MFELTKILSLITKKKIDWIADHKYEQPEIFNTFFHFQKENVLKMLRGM